jgi:hypothetical protein
MEFKIGLAGRIINIRSIYQDVYDMCRDYLVDSGDPDISVDVLPADIEFEREKSFREAVYEGIVPVPYPEPYLETLAVYRKIASSMIEFDTFLMHGAVVGMKSDSDTAEAVLFAASSGVGKTTHMKLWLDEIPGTFVVNGDKPLVRFVNGRFEVCGTPWAGKEGLETNTILPLKAICHLERGETDSIKRIRFEENYPLLFQQAYRPTDEKQMIKTMELIKRLGSEVPLYRLRCTPDPSAARVAYEGIFG